MKEKEKPSSLLEDIWDRMEQKMKNPRVVVLTPSMMEDMTPEKRAKRKEEFLKKYEHRRLKV